MIKSQDELNTCNDGKRKSDVLIATIEKCEKLEKQLKIAILALEYIKKLPVRVCCDNTAEQALKEIEAVNDEKSI
jgi:hypothetical protein